MKWINFGRCCGKTALMINASFATGIPIIVQNEPRKKLLLDQAKVMGADGIVVFTINEWLTYGRCRTCDDKVLIDEAQNIIEDALRCYMHAEVVSATMTVPMLKQMEMEKNDRAD